jgi:peroxiredoxin Q/BCP
MKRLVFLAFILIAAISANAFEPVEKGDRVPDFTAKDENGKDWTFSDQRAQYLVFYFYPAAFTGGCTKQACSYRDHDADFDKLRATIVGISGDEHENLKQFKQHHDLNFTLLSDPDGSIAELFGVPTREGGNIEREVDGNTLQLARGVTTSRWTFIVDGSKGRVLYKDEEVAAATDPETVLKFITTHNARKSCVTR